jgi:hypothetical protein
MPEPPYQIEGQSKEVGEAQHVYIFLGLSVCTGRNAQWNSTWICFFPTSSHPFLPCIYLVLIFMCQWHSLENTACTCISPWKLLLCEYDITYTHSRIIHIHSHVRFLILHKCESKWYVRIINRLLINNTYTSIIFLDIIHRPVSIYNISETGFCLRLQVTRTQFGPILSPSSGNTYSVWPNSVSVFR